MAWPGGLAKLNLAPSHEIGDERPASSGPMISHASLLVVAVKMPASMKTPGRKDVTMQVDTGGLPDTTGHLFIIVQWARTKRLTVHHDGRDLVL